MGIPVNIYPMIAHSQFALESHYLFFSTHDAPALSDKGPIMLFTLSMTDMLLQAV